MNKLLKKLTALLFTLLTTLGVSFFVAYAQTSTPSTLPITLPNTQPTIPIAVPPVAKPPLKFNLTYKDQTFPVEQNILESWEGKQQAPQNYLLAPKPQSFSDSILQSLGQNPSNTKLPENYNHKVDLIYGYVKTLSEKINLPVREPILEIVNNHVATFTPPQTGIVVDSYNSAINAAKALDSQSTSSELTSHQIFPKNSVASTNNLGINELVAQGTSKFNGSPKNRRFNIAVGIEKMKGVIVPQGGEFSFNDNLGPVDGEHGFKPELVIKGKNTLPEFGGGLCQVSSTAFRAAMQAGLPITERRNHAYPVQYYAPQGTDATIYPGVVDLKFINDTPGAILVWPYLKDKDTLVFDFYGTKDSRQVTLEKPVVISRSTDGVLKTSWTRVIKVGDQNKTDVFKSTYLPAALFHHEESFVTTAPPTTGLQIPTKVQ